MMKSIFRFTTPRGLTLLIVNWLDKIAEERKNVQKYFGKLQRFAENIKPISKLSDDVRTHVEQLIHSAFVCHLDFENVSTIILVIHDVSLNLFLKFLSHLEPHFSYSEQTKDQG